MVCYFNLFTMTASGQFVSKTLQDGKFSFGPGLPETAQAAWQNSPLFELARVFVRFDHVARINGLLQRLLPRAI
jgi:hypothetical protein